MRAIRATGAFRATATRFETVDPLRDTWDTCARVHTYGARYSRSFTIRTLFTVGARLILEPGVTHVRGGGSMSYGKRVHNSPVSHAFTWPSNVWRREPAVHRTTTTKRLPRFAHLQLEIIHRAPRQVRCAHRVGISLTT